MNVKLLSTACALAAVCAGCLAGVGAGAAAVPQPELDTWLAKPSLGARAMKEVAVSIPAAAAEAGKVTIYVPSGYALNPSGPPGTHEGYAFMATASDFAFGELQAVNPAAYANSPQAQACAPGAHMGVWIMHFEDGFFSSQSSTVPIYVDPTSGDEAALGAYKLQACLPLAAVVSPGGSPIGTPLRGIELEFTQITNPTSAANYVWRAFVSNPDANGNPDPATTYELRSDMPLPAKLTLTKRFVAKHHRARLSGRLTTSAAPTGGVTVTLYRRSGFGWKSVASTQTRADGSYRFTHPIAKTGTYATETGAVGACTGASTAPNGCLSETRAAIDSPNVRIVFGRRR